MNPFTTYWTEHFDEFSNRAIDPRKQEAYPYLDPCAKIIDLGCGVGNDLDYFKDKGKEVVGVTYQQREVEVAHQQGRNVIHADIQDLPFGDNTFDGFVCYDALEHTPCPYIALCEARRILKSGGRGIIFIPGQQWTETAYHLLVPTQRQMKWLLKQSGWKLDRMEDLSHRQEEMALYFVIKP